MTSGVEVSWDLISSGMLKRFKPWTAFPRALVEFGPVLGDSAEGYDEDLGRLRPVGGHTVAHGRCMWSSYKPTPSSESKHPPRNIWYSEEDSRYGPTWLMRCPGGYAGQTPDDPSLLEKAWAAYGNLLGAGVAGNKGDEGEVSA